MSGDRDVIFHIPSLQGGGAERVAVEIAKHFVSKGCVPVFFVHANEAAYRLPAGVEVVVAQKAGHVGRVLELAALIRKRRPKAVISFLPYANIISVLACRFSRSRARIVVSEHLAFAHLSTADMKARLKSALACRLYSACHSIVAVSTGVARDLQSAVTSRALDKIVVIHNPCYVVNTAGYEPSLKRNGRTVLAIGRLVDQKGFDVLIRAFAALRTNLQDVELVIAGEGPERDRLEMLIRELGLVGCVSLRGFVEDIGALYRDADLFVCSSRIEGFGNVIVEALSYGVPVVSTRCPHGPEEILQDGRYGRLVTVDDVAGLATAITETLSSAVDRGRLRERAKDFSLQSIGDRYLEVAGLVAGCTPTYEEHRVVA